MCVWSTPADARAPPATGREVERSSPWPPRLSPFLSPAALSSFCLSPSLPKNKAPSCRLRRPRVQMNRRSPYLESFAIFTKLKTSMQAAGHPEHRGCGAPSHASNGSPMAGRDLSAPRGSSGDDGGWRRWTWRARTWRRWLLPPSGRELRVHPRAGPLTGVLTVECWKTQWRRGRGGCKARGGGEGGPGRVRPGLRDRRAPWGAEARARGACSRCPARRPGCPACGGAQTEPGGGGRAWHARTHPSRHCSCLPASFPKLSPFSSPHPHPRGSVGGGGSPVTSCVCLQTRKIDLTVSGTPGTGNATRSLPKPKESRATAGCPKPWYVP